MTGTGGCESVPFAVWSSSALAANSKSMAAAAVGLRCPLRCLDRRERAMGPADIFLLVAAFQRDRAIEAREGSRPPRSLLH
jgi:hypothetical protein